MRLFDLYNRKLLYSCFVNIFPLSSNMISVEINIVPSVALLTYGRLLCLEWNIIINHFLIK